MRRFRLSIAGSMLAVLVIAVGLAALRRPTSAIWASATFTATVFVLLVATLGAFIGREPSWAGFALFGWAGMILAFGPWPTAVFTPAPIPLSTAMLKETYIRTYGHAYDQDPDVISEGYHHANAITHSPLGQSYVVHHAYLQTGSSLAILVVACVGGGVGGLLAACFDRSRPADAP